MSRGSVSLIRYCYPPDGMNTPMRALSRALIEEGIPTRGLQQFAPVRLLGRALGKFELNRLLLPRRGTGCLATYAWPNDGPAFPYGFFNEIIPWICDCWPRNYDKWERLFGRGRTKLAFFSAQGSANYFRERMPHMTSLWMPEGCDPSEYDPKRPLCDRSIQVLEIGRKHTPFHGAVTGPLAAARALHIFARNGTLTPIYPDQASLHAALADSFVSVCFPRVDTHPELAGGLETVTLRYFESMASGCLIVGRCPAELQELFGYNPVIEVDWADPWSQLKSILERPAAYQELVGKNLARLMEVGTWRSRAHSIIHALEEHGWSVSLAVGNRAASAAEAAHPVLTRTS